MEQGIGYFYDSYGLSFHLHIAVLQKYAVHKVL